MNLLKLLLCISCAVFTGCKEADSNSNKGNSKDSSESISSKTLDKPKGSPFLSTSDLKAPSNLSFLSKDEMIEALNENAELYYEDSDSSEESECSKLISNGKVTASKNLVTLDTTYDVRKCMGIPEITRATARVFIHLSCDKADLSDLNNKLYGTIKDTVVEKCNNSTVSVLTQMEFISDIKSVSNGNTETIRSIYKSAKMTANGKPCKFKVSGEKISYDECISTQITETINSTRNGKEIANPSGSFTSVRIKGVTATENERYFDTGTFSIIINNWSGTAKAIDNKSPPTWSMKSDDETATGVFSGLSLMLHDADRDLKRKLFHPKLR